LLVDPWSSAPLVLPSSFRLIPPHSPDSPIHTATTRRSTPKARCRRRLSTERDSRGGHHVLYASRTFNRAPRDMPRTQAAGGVRSKNVKKGSRAPFFRIDGWRPYRGVPAHAFENGGLQFQGIDPPRVGRPHYGPLAAEDHQDRSAGHAVETGRQKAVVLLLTDGDPEALLSGNGAAARANERPSRWWTALGHSSTSPSVRGRQPRLNRGFPARPPPATRGAR